MALRRRLAAAVSLFLAPSSIAGRALGADATSVTVPVLSPPPAMTGAVDASWSKAASLTLGYDFVYRRAAAEPTTVYLSQEDGALDVAFVATQKESLTAVQQTNGPGVTGDDNVTVYLYPQGTQGFAYTFSANPRGARFQTSSENAAFSPEWIAAGKSSPGGYTVTMRIPLDVIRSGGSTSWTAQFTRSTVATGALSVWTFSDRATSAADPAFAGIIDGIGGDESKTSRNKPRVQFYGLAEAASASVGGNTSRIGADLSIPVSPTASFVGTLHPDYSNVEVDQQTIEPTTFARQYTEVRPFFTQTGQFFNVHAGCSDCPLTLYTPSIPTFGEGYAVEGTQGPFSFAAFDAIAAQRSDAAQTLNYSFENKDYSTSASFQRVAVDLPGLHDDATTLNVGLTDQRNHLSAYVNGGQDRGTNVTDPGQGNYFETGASYGTSTTFFGISLQRIGAAFNPVSGYVAQTDIDGYESFGSKTWNFSPAAPVHDVGFNGFYARYHNRLGQPAQSDANAEINVDFRDLVTVHVFGGASGALSCTGQNAAGVCSTQFLPFNGNGFFLGYRVGTTTPSSVTYTGGAYFHGKLDAWSYVATIPLARSIHLGLEMDENQYESSYPGEFTFRQWLERAGIEWQFSRDASFDVGARRIIGPNLPNAIQPPAFDNSPAVCSANAYNPGCFVNATNLSFAFHFLAAKNEFYVVYGNPNNLATYPALIFKWIRYIGAEKGT